MHRTASADLLQELPESHAPLVHRHVYFAHAFKHQAGWQALLQRFGAGGGALLDLEFLVDEHGTPSSRRAASHAQAAAWRRLALPRGMRERRWHSTRGPRARSGARCMCWLRCDGGRNDVLVGPIPPFASNAALHAHLRARLAGAARHAVLAVTVARGQSVGDGGGSAGAVWARRGGAAGGHGHSQAGRSACSTGTHATAAHR